MDPESRPDEQSTDDVTLENAAPPSFVSVELVLEEESNVLYAHVVEVPEPVALDLPALQQMLDGQGFASLSFEPNALNGVLRRVQNREFGEYAIAHRRDAEISVSATADKLQVLLTTTRAYGGETVTLERLRGAIAKARIAESVVSSEALQRAVREQVVSNLVIGKGTAPQSGSDSRLEMLINLDDEVSRPREGEDGRVDHYSVRDFVIVEPGTRLARRHPPTRGVPGRDVFGKTITARDGKDIPLPKEMPGVLPDPRDPTVLVAEYKGHPVAIAGGIRVDKTLLMEYVDLRTGNIDFDGSVLVKGDVAAGVVVKATGDITVKGTVENSGLDAGGNLAVARGITGSESAMNGGKREVLVRAAGNLEAGFASGVELAAGQDVSVKEYLNHCETLALDRVLVGQKGGHGLIVGGTTHGCQGVLARVMGSPANVKTFLSVGSHDEMERSREEALQERRDLLARLEQLKTMLASMEAKTGDDGEPDKLAEKVRRTIEDFERRTVEVDVRIEDLGAQCETAEQAAVSCNQRVYPGVVVEIGGAVLSVRTEGTGGCFQLKDGEISWE